MYRKNVTFGEKMKLIFLNNYTLAGLFFVLCMAIIFFMVTGNTIFHSFDFLKNKETVSGKISSITRTDTYHTHHIRKNHHYDEDEKDYIYKYKFGYRVDGKSYKAINYGENLYQEKQTVKVTYFVNDPSSAKVDQLFFSKKGIIPFFLFIILFFFLLLSIYTFFYGVKKGLHYVFLFKNGVFTSARVINKLREVQESRNNGKVKSTYTFTYTFEFQDQIGQTYVFKEKYNEDLFFEDQTDIKIIYDPKNPSDAVTTSSLPIKITK